MKQIFKSVALLVFMIALVVVSFTVQQVWREEQRLKEDLQQNTAVMARAVRDALEVDVNRALIADVQARAERYAALEGIAGLVVFGADGQVLSSAPPSLPVTPVLQDQARRATDGDVTSEQFVGANNSKQYVYAVPLRDDGRLVVGAVVLVRDATFIQARVIEIWKNNLLRLLFQALLVSVAMLLLLRLVLYKPLRNLVESMRTTRLGNGEIDESLEKNSSFFQPLLREASLMRRYLVDARTKANQEARLRLEKLDSPWTEERLKVFIQESLHGRPLVVVSNREPYIHEMQNGSPTYFFPASGMATALEPMMEASGGTWVAHGSGGADRSVVDEHDHIRVPPDEPSYTLRRVWLTKAEEAGYYYGFSNESLWPLCHHAHVRPVFREVDWDIYRQANAKFARAVLQEVKNTAQPVIFIQDYHLTLLPQLIKKSRPDAIVGLFWHIPWPNPESFSICPYRKEILTGMLGADLIGFHTQLFANNFIETVGQQLESLINWEQLAVTRAGHTTAVKAFPISVAFADSYPPKTFDKSVQLHSANVREQFNIRAHHIGLGVDRLDYTKGILERFKALEILFEKYPRFRERFTFIQVAPQSRSELKTYQQFEAAVVAEARRVNEQYSTNDWTPIILLRKRHTHEELATLYRAADVCVVTSLHDGMNLVAKEYVAAREDEGGALVLSEFTGAASELRGAFIVNPYDAEDVANNIVTALELTRFEQQRRMRKLRDTVRHYNAYRWSADVLKTLFNLS